MAIDPTTPVLMFSSGLDSFIIRQLCNIPNTQCIFVRMGTTENEIEEQRIDQFHPGVTKVDLPLAPFALENNIIPFRNHMLTLIGLQFSNKVCFGFTAGDTTRDKDYVFKAQMEGVANYFGGVPEKVKVQGPYEIQMPYKSFSKSQLVGLYLANPRNKPIDLLTHTISCYEGFDAIYGCGRCRSCLRKYVALCNAEDIVDNLGLASTMRAGVDNDPLDWIEIFLKESIIKGRNYQEIEEIKKCIEKML